MASQSDIAGSDELHFTGESAEEAEDFIQAVNKRAYAAGKQRDNTWIAEFAYPFFSRTALRWYEDLDEGIQNDWKLLKRAILAEFTGRQPAPSTVPSAAPAVISSSCRFVPAAPPPPAVTKMIGRIRVEGEDHRLKGYLTLTANSALVLEDINGASVFEADRSSQTLTLKGEQQSLVIKAVTGSYSLRPGTYHYGNIARPSALLGRQWSNIWSVIGDGNVVTSSLEANGRKCEAEFVVTISGARKNIYVPADTGVFLARFEGHTVATLYFETMS